MKCIEVATFEHPFYVKDHGFVNAGELYIGDKLLDPNGNILLVEDVKFETTTELTTVYNFQVEDFHTYHVGGCGVLVHNAGTSYQNDNGDFVGKLHGEDVELKNVKMKDIEYIKRNPAETNSLRNNFNSSAKKDFLNELSNMKDSSLKKMGLSNKGILQIRDGKVPKGYQVHHKLPLDDSGNNSFENLNLIKNDPYHKVITNYQNTFSRGMSPGDKIDVKWPIPKGSVYIGK